MKVGAMKILKEIFFFNHFKNTSGTFKNIFFSILTKKKER
jgi:hypothetical protein